MPPLSTQRATRMLTPRQPAPAWHMIPPHHPSVSGAPILCRYPALLQCHAIFRRSPFAPRRRGPCLLCHAALRCRRPPLVGATGAAGGPAPQACVPFDRPNNLHALCSLACAPVSRPLSPGLFSRRLARRLARRGALRHPGGCCVNCARPPFLRAPQSASFHALMLSLDCALTRLSFTLGSNALASTPFPRSGAPQPLHAALL